MPSKYVDFQELKERFPIEKVVDLLGINMRTKSNQLRGACPACEGNDRSLAVTPSKGLFYCFNSEQGGDTIALVAHVRGCSVKDAACWLAGGNSDTVPPTKQEKVKEERKPSEGFAPLDYLQSDHEAVEAIGLEPYVAEALGIGYAPRGVLRGTVAIPLRKPDGTIAGYIGVTDIEKLPPKWHL